MVFSTTSVQAAVTIEPISDMTDADSCLDLIQQERMTLEPAPLRAQRIAVRLPSLALLLHATDKRLQTRTRLPDDVAAITALGPLAAGTIDGMAIEAGKMLLAGPGAEARFVVEAGYQSIVMLAAPDFIAGLLSRLPGTDRLALPSGVQVLTANGPKSQALFQTGKRIADAAAQRPELFDRDRPERVLAEAELLDTLLAALLTTARSAPQGGGKTHLSHDRLVRLAERFVLDHLAERVHVADLCCATDVSERTLEIACRKVTGLSPVAYFTRLRLERARRALLDAVPGSTRVSKVALRCGFWHFGEFSAAYRRSFGEAPSETLRRQPGPR